MGDQLELCESKLTSNPFNSVTCLFFQNDGYSVIFTYLEIIICDMCLQLDVLHRLRVHFQKLQSNLRNAVRTFTLTSRTFVSSNLPSAQWRRCITRCCQEEEGKKETFQVPPFVYPSLQVIFSESKCRQSQSLRFMSLWQRLDVCLWGAPPWDAADTSLHRCQSQRR